jgi:hypothetical protein
VSACRDRTISTDPPPQVQERWVFSNQEDDGDRRRADLGPTKRKLFDARPFEYCHFSLQFLFGRGD